MRRRTRRILAPFKGCLYWADARKLHAFNQSFQGRSTQFMLLLPLGKWSGVGLIRLKKEDLDGEV